MTGTFNTKGDIDDDVGEGTGVLIVATPVDGFALGFGTYAVDAFGTAKNDAKYTFGAKYAPWPILLVWEAVCPW